MGGKMSRNKGQRGEREAAELLMTWAKEVVEYLRGSLGGEKFEDIKLVRNLNQARVGSDGSYDLVGLDWLALEVKRHETLNVTGWWRQTVAQAGVDSEGNPQVPMLMYRQNRGKWRFKVRAPMVVLKGFDPVVLDFELDVENAAVWFKTELCSKLSNKCR